MMEKKESIQLDDEEIAIPGISDSLHAALKALGHYTCDYSNGLCCGVHFEAVPGTRGVHVDVVHVLDLRNAEFGRSGLAMRAALLEVVNRPLQGILSDLGLAGILVEKTIPSPFGRVSLILLESLLGKGSSLVHETRTVYVVREDTRTSLDLSWLTDSSRVIAASDFLLARRSDMRAMLPNLHGIIVDSKWPLLQTAVRNGWLGAISLMGVPVGLAAMLFVLAVGSGSFLMPLLTMVASGLIGGTILSSARRAVTEFREILNSEEERLAHLGDRKSIDKSIADNEEQLRLLGDISFVVSPLMAVIGLAIEAGEMDEAADNACQVLDECVRLTPPAVNSNKDGPGVGDEGLRRFLSLFDTLGVRVTEENLALAYVALTGHMSNPLSFSELVSHVETLNNTLFDAGILRPEIKESVDDRINRKAMEAVMEAFEESSESDDDVRAEVSETQKPSDSSSEDDRCPYVDEICPEFLSEIRDSRADELIEAETSEGVGEDETCVIVATTMSEDENSEEIISATCVLNSQKETPQKDYPDMAQSSLFDAVSDLMELGKDPVTKEEGGPAGT